MISKGDHRHRSIKDRRENHDRRKGSDRRKNSSHRRIHNSVADVVTDAGSRDEILTTKEACEYLKVSRPTYLKCIADGKIRAKKVGRGWRVLRSELEKSLCEE